MAVSALCSGRLASVICRNQEGLVVTLACRWHAIRPISSLHFHAAATLPSMRAANHCNVLGPLPPGAAVNAPVTSTVGLMHALRTEMPAVPGPVTEPGRPRLAKVGGVAISDWGPRCQWPGTWAHFAFPGGHAGGCSAPAPHSAHLAHEPHRWARSVSEPHGPVARASSKSDST